MRYFSILSILLLFASAKAQSPVTINKSTFKVGGVSNEYIYFGAKAGDQINVSVKKKLPIKKIGLMISKKLFLGNMRAMTCGNPRV